MASAREIKSRIGSVKNTQKITRAMKTVAAVRFKQAQQRILTARPYARKLVEVIRNVEANVTDKIHPLLTSRPVANVALVVVGSDKGLCGSFNANVLRKAAEAIRSFSGKNVKLIPVGRKIRDGSRRWNLPVLSEAIGVFGRVQFPAALEFTQGVVGHFLSGAVDEIHFVYNEFKTAMTQKPTVERLIPLPQGELSPTGYKMDYLFEPGPAEVLDKLLPRYAAYQVYRILLESQASEFGARMTAMDAATKSAGEMVQRLTLQYNKARQAAITKELLEVVAGAEVLR